MKRLLAVSFFVCLVWGLALADTFGTGGNQFTIDFVPISGDSGNLGSWSAGDGYTFSGVNHDDYRMGKFEITNDQWDKFKNSLGVPVTGSPSYAYLYDAGFTGTNVTNRVSWYEAAQFVNWLNTSKGYQAAYKFTGTQGTIGYSLAVWDASDAWGGTNLYRHKDAYYFLPTEDEWVKAAYWNGSSLQTYATPGNTLPVAGVDTNYYDGVIGQPWDVGSGSRELNGTYDMMGNVREWMESPYVSGDLSGSIRGIRGGAYNSFDYTLSSSYRYAYYAYTERTDWGFRVASIPEPCTLVLMLMGGVGLLRRRKA